MTINLSPRYYSWEDEFSVDLFTSPRPATTEISLRPKKILPISGWWQLGTSPFCCLSFKSMARTGFKRHFTIRLNS